MQARTRLIADEPGWRFQLLDARGEVVAMSEPHDSRPSCVAALDVVLDLLADIQVVPA